MFSALARSIYHRRWWTLGASGLVLIGVIAALKWGGTLTTGAIEGTETEHTQRLVEGLAGLSGDSVIAAVVGSDEWKFNLRFGKRSARPSSSSSGIRTFSR